MVLNQAVAKNWRRRAQLTGGVTLLSLAAGCQWLGMNGREEVSAPTPVAESRPVAIDTGPDSAIDAAIAREASGTSAVDMPSSSTPAVELNANAPKSYTVKRGDTLWDISAMFLRDPWLWPEIWHVNPSVQNPHLIYPGDQLLLAYGANGEPQLRLVRGDALRVQPLVRGTAIDGPIATIPYDAISAFLGRPSIVSKEDMKRAPHVVALRDQHLVAGTGHDIYVRGLKDENPGRYSVVRVGDPLKDPETGKVLGYMGVYTAAARVDKPDKITRATLLESTRETQAGDLLFADTLQASSADITPRAPPAGVDGQIMAVVDGVQLIGQYQVVAVNRGSKHGLENGHVLAIDQRGEVVRDASCRRSEFSWCLGKKVQLPDERAGTLLVFKTYEQMSYGLIVATVGTVRVADRVRSP